MRDELELKAVVTDPEGLRARLRGAGAVEHFRGRMSDRRYDRADELALRNEVLRVRSYHEANGRVASILGWKGPVRLSPEGYKQRAEVELPVNGDSATPHTLLAALGYDVVQTIDRDVDVYHLGGATVRLERYPRMDALVEVEGAPAAIEQAIAATGIPRAEFTADPLAEFVRRFEERRGVTARLALT